VDVELYLFTTFRPGRAGVQHVPPAQGLKILGAHDFILLVYFML
jgi:hypothetical protein